MDALGELETSKEHFPSSRPSKEGRYPHFRKMKNYIQPPCKYWIREFLKYEIYLMGIHLVFSNLSLFKKNLDD